MGEGGKLKDLMAEARVNGQDVMGLLQSGKSLHLGDDVLVHFPAATHANDPTDGECCPPRHWGMHGGWHSKVGWGQLKGWEGYSSQG